MSLSGVGGASAAPVVCDSTNGKAAFRTTPDQACGARGEGAARAHAEERTGVGTAIASARTNGKANAYNLGAKSTALAGAATRGTSYSVTAGPGGYALAQARRGGLTVAIAGIGGTALAGDPGVKCSGGFAIAYDSTTGKYCFGTGRTYITNMR
ncbi:hypothetical protein KIK15_09390 [Williamsia sp. CHRR-6]|nr:hypothetical protein [Williamsia sp. CHRR-6]